MLVDVTYKKTEMKTNAQKIEIYTSILLGVFRLTKTKSKEDSKDFPEEIRKKLKFENIGDDIKLRACIDLLEDTQYSIDEFVKNGLYTIDSSNTLGEKYLRLYGLLNAVYLQKQTVIELIEIFKIPFKSKRTVKFKELKILELRNKIGSHTVNYKEYDKIRSYRLVQFNIDKFATNLMVIGDTKESESFNLFSDLEVYTELLDSNLSDICDKAIKLFPKNSKTRIWLDEKREDLSTMK